MRQISLPILGSTSQSGCEEGGLSQALPVLLGTSKFLQKSFALRYQVYCEERKFLSASAFPQKLEFDRYDAHSAHFGVLCSKGDLLASVRLVYNSGAGFPMEEYWDDVIPEWQRETMAEISRLVVPRRNSTQKGGASKFSMTMQIYAEIYKSVKKSHLTHVLAAMEPSLVRLLRRFGFKFQEIGEAVDYFGLVKPYVLSLEDFEQAIEKACPDLREVFYLEREEKMTA